MSVDYYAEALRSLAVETGSIACLGCGHEHNCSVHGCAILRGAASELQKLRASRDAWVRQCEALQVERDFFRDRALSLDEAFCSNCANGEAADRCNNEFNCESCLESGCPCRGCDFDGLTGFRLKGKQG